MLVANVELGPGESPLQLLLEPRRHHRLAVRQHRHRRLLWQGSQGETRTAPEPAAECLVRSSTRSEALASLQDGQLGLIEPAYLS